MTDKELITALRKACQDCNPTPCCEYELLGSEAADRIERLKKEIFKYKKEIFKYKEEAAKYKAERDKAVEDIRVGWTCRACENRIDGSEWLECPLKSFAEGPEKTVTCDNFVWRGLEESE